MGNYRVSGGYTFPWEIQLSGVFQSLPTEPLAGTGAAAGRRRGNYTVTNAAPGPHAGPADCHAGWHHHCAPG
jgi:hypothetical protein